MATRATRTLRSLREVLMNDNPPGRYSKIRSIFSRYAARVPITFLNACSVYKTSSNSSLSASTSPPVL